MNPIEAAFNKWWGEVPEVRPIEQNAFEAGWKAALAAARVVEHDRGPPTITIHKLPDDLDVDGGREGRVGRRGVRRVAEDHRQRVERGLEAFLELLMSVDDLDDQFVEDPPTYIGPPPSKP